jgi:ubiquinol-cytochrome c reductase iron-sulfur subunit
LPKAKLRRKRAGIGGPWARAGKEARADYKKEPVQGERGLDSTDAAEPTRRDFLYVATVSVGAIGAALAAWPFIDQMNPDAAALALATTEVDISAIEPGMSVTVKWRGRPVFIRNRTAAEVEAAKDVPLDQLKDPYARNGNLPDDAPATDENRTVTGRENLIVMVGVCTHLGCVPLGQSGDYGGWFCPCHGSHYDTSGRIRSGPAPENLPVPNFSFLSDTLIQIG